MANNSNSNRSGSMGKDQKQTDASKSDPAVDPNVGTRSGFQGGKQTGSVPGRQSQKSQGEGVADEESALNRPSEVDGSEQMGSDGEAEVSESFNTSDTDTNSDR